VRLDRIQEDGMLASTVVAGTNVVAISYGGPVRTDEMLDAREEIDTVVHRHGTARLLVVYDHFDPTRWEPLAMWSDLQIGRLLRDVDRVAVVAEADWVDDLRGVDGNGRWIRGKGFRADRRSEALAWLQESLEHRPAPEGR
jgi:hypothetical protein